MVATLIGHKDIQTTYSTYVHLADETLRKSANKHPLMRGNTKPKEMLDELSSMIKRLGIEKDNRFNYSLNESNNSLELKVSFAPEKPNLKYL
jgi:hypothetical protein